MLDFLSNFTGITVTAEFYPIIFCCGTVFAMLFVHLFNDLIKVLFGAHL